MSSNPELLSKILGISKSTEPKIGLFSNSNHQWENHSFLEYGRWGALRIHYEFAPGIFSL